MQQACETRAVSPWRVTDRDPSHPTLRRNGSRLTMHRTIGLTNYRPVHTGDYSRRFRRQFVAQFGDCCQKRRLLPNSATVAKNGNSRRFWRQSPNWATIVASVDRPFGDSRRFWQQSPNSATVAGFGDSRRIGRL